MTTLGPHISVPLKLIGLRGDEEATAQEILALTKMNWNSGGSNRCVSDHPSLCEAGGLIMAEVPPDRTPHPAYRFYM